jgi:hypothetical protein
VATAVVSIEVHGVPAWQRALTLRLFRMERATWIATRDGLRLLERAIKTNLGRYSHAPGTPTPSPPGEPPARISGNLARSVTPDGPWPGRKVWTTVGSVGPTAKQSRAQELGYKPGNLPARPYVRPAAIASRVPLHAIYVRRWTQALSR